MHGFPGYGPTDPIPTVVQVLDGAKPANTRPVRVDTTPGAISRYSGGGTTINGTRWVVQTKEAVIVVIPDSFKVRAIIRRQGIGTFFGRIMGESIASVSAKAAAEAVNSNGTKCVKPFALPDMWQDLDDDNVIDVLDNCPDVANPDQADEEGEHD